MTSYHSGNVISIHCHHSNVVDSEEQYHAAEVQPLIAVLGTTTLPHDDHSRSGS